MIKKDFYRVLGIPRDANAEQIKKRFIELAKKYHPDVSNDKEAETKFRDVSEAYETLSDPQKRDLYDKYGEDYSRVASESFDFDRFKSRFNFGGDLEDIFSGLFGGDFEGLFSGSTVRSPAGFPGGYQNIKQPGDTRVERLKVDRKDVEKSISVRIKIHHSCPACQGTGASNPMKDITQCPDCKGRGMVSKVKKMIGFFIKELIVCERCRGSGRTIVRKCDSC